jgi:hypothetical protein
MTDPTCSFLYVYVTDYGDMETYPVITQSPVHNFTGTKVQHCHVALLTDWTADMNKKTGIDFLT